MDAYVHLLTALCLNAPLISLALSRHLEGVPPLTYPGIYAQMVFLGYYDLLLLVLLSVLFLLTAFSRRLAVAAGGVLLFAALAFLVINSFVHRIYRFHVDAFWLGYVINSYQGMGVSPAILGTVAFVLLLIAALEWALFRAATSLKRPWPLAAGFIAIALLACLASQTTHVFAYYHNDTRITRITPQLPFYAPLVSQSSAARYQGLVGLGIEPEDLSEPAAASLQYPLHPMRWNVPASRPNILLLVLESWRYDTMDSLVSPNIYALAKRSSLFLNHISSGNATPHGIFGLFYGIHPTYWGAVKANNALIHNPVLVDVLEANNYAFGIYADSQFGRHKIKDAMFRGIEVQEKFAGSTAAARDADLTEQLIGFMDEQKRRKAPFFGFAFYKSTHFSYDYPSPGHFQPARELNLTVTRNVADASEYLNDYRNSVYYTDSLVGRILDRLESTGLMEETIVIVTSDHAEEFNDNRAGWWGHCGNFTRYQTQVPLVFYFPGRAPCEVTDMTTHVDVPTTLLTEVFGCGSVRDWSNGRDLFVSPRSPRPFVVAGYVNHAFVMGDDVHVVYPMLVQSYKLSDIKVSAGAARPELGKLLIEETHRFYRPAPHLSLAVGAAPSTLEPAETGPRVVMISGTRQPVRHAAPRTTPDGPMRGR